ncbi:cytochrome-c peroxidase [Thermopetrobacter sp. TC1]|uniref:cytochrome-c peroxidase n=1 Tax=Thermopetrobacter sp. TC1 TaxID=1495045 RepID=UPI00056EFDD7|nr:cytochrome-c peroxidase [Thermopetrobacter sp. TC1]
MKLKTVLVAAAAAVLAVSAGIAQAEDSLLKQARELFQPIPTFPPQLKDNPLTTAKIELGKMLFFDPRLSASQLISCNTCHNLGMGGDDNLETSIGHGFAKGPRNAPTVLNAVFNVAQFWDGRAKDLEEQAKGPVQAGVEMNNRPEVVVATLKSIPEYVEAFRKAFPQDKDPVTFDNMAKAIEAFEATLTTPDSRFDQYLRGDEKALNDLEKKGLALFIDKGCAGCHQGINIGGQDYFPFGVVEKPGADILPPDDKGRFKVTKAKDDEFSFRAAPLRNVALTAPYFHSGKVWSLREAVRIMGDAQLGKGTLSEDDVTAITAFLKTLTGRQPEITYPFLPPSTEKTPKPVR